MSEGTTKQSEIKINNLTQDRNDWTNKNKTVFLPGSETPSKTIDQLTDTAPTRQQVEDSDPYIDYEDFSVDFTEETNLLTTVKGELVESSEVEFQSDESGSKESHYAIGSRTENYNICTTFDSGMYCINVKESPGIWMGF